MLGIFYKNIPLESNDFRQNNTRDAASSFASIFEETPAKLAAMADQKASSLRKASEGHGSTSLLRSFEEHALLRPSADGLRRVSS